MKLIEHLINLVGQNEDAVIHLGYSATNFLQTTLLSMVRQSAFACMAMTAKCESRSVVVLRSQVWILRTLRW